MGIYLSESGLKLLKLSMKLPIKVQWLSVTED